MSIPLKTNSLAKAFQGKIALVTGGSTGIGLATAQVMAKSGAHVWIVARRKELIETALNSIQASRKNADQRFGFTLADVSVAEQASMAVAQVSETLGIPDLVINSAGITHPGYVEKLDLEIFRRMIDVNYLGTVYITKAILPGMMERHSGHIVNISSIAGFLGVFGYSAYAASKYAVRGFSDVLRAEMKPHGVRVSIVFPPDTNTPQLAYEKTIKPLETQVISSKGKILSPEAVAKAILKGIMHKQYIILPGLESKLIYHLGSIWYPYMDFLIANTRKKNSWKERLLP